MASATAHRIGAAAVALAAAMHGGRLTAQQTPPPGCVSAPETDGAPWVWNTRVLKSFPPDTPRPAFVGAFRDAEFEVHLWRDSKGVFGELLLAEYEADPPTSRFYDSAFDAATGRISFTTRLPGGERAFAGRLQSRTLTGTLTDARRRRSIVLRKRRDRDIGLLLHDFYTSRAQFDCSMFLFRRY